MDDEIHAAIDSLDSLPYRFKVFEENKNPAETVRLNVIEPFRDLLHG